MTADCDPIQITVYGRKGVIADPALPAEAPNPERQSQLLTKFLQHLITIFIAPSKSALPDQNFDLGRTIVFRLYRSIRHAVVFDRYNPKGRRKFPLRPIQVSKVWLYQKFFAPRLKHSNSQNKFG